MSLTNAISAIAVVGSIVIAGEQKQPQKYRFRDSRGHRFVINVVGGYLITIAWSTCSRNGDLKAMNEIYLHIIYLAATACFILALKWLSAVSSARRGSHHRGHRHGFRRGRHATQAGNRKLPVDRHRLCFGNHHRRADGDDPMTAVPSTNRAIPRSAHWPRWSEPRNIFCKVPNLSKFIKEPCALKSFWDFSPYRQPDGIRQITGNFTHPKRSSIPIRM